MREMNEQIDGNQNSRVKLKQRITGGAVLLIVLAIFLPFIFNHTRHEATTVPTDNTANMANAAAQQPAEPAAAQPEQPPAQSVAETTADPNAAAPVQSMSSDQPGLTPLQSEAAAPVVEPAPESLPAPAASASPSLSQEPALTAPAPAAPVTSVQQQDLPAPAPTTRQLPVPAAKAQPAPRGHWVLQAGSFMQAEYAQQLAAKLRARGFSVYTQRDQNQLTRVYVGPFTSQQQAQKIQQQVQNEFQLNGLVREKR